MKKARLVAAIVLAASTAAWGQSKPATASQPATASRPATLPFTISKETTWITGPLRSDGRVDYVAALNARSSAGVTKENNAAVEFIQIIGTELLPGDTADEICRILDIECPVIRALDLALPLRSKDLLTKPWQIEEYPEVVDWLKENKSALDRFVAATNRPRYYIPFLPPVAEQGMLKAQIPSLSKYRLLAQVLAMRANLAINEDRFEDAWSDIQAMYRLSLLINQDMSLIGCLVALACGQIGDNAVHRMVASERLDAKTSRLILSKWSEVQATPTVVDSVDAGERYSSVMNCV